MADKEQNDIMSRMIRGQDSGVTVVRQEELESFAQKYGVAKLVEIGDAFVKKAQYYYAKDIGDPTTGRDFYVHCAEKCLKAAIHVGGKHHNYTKNLDVHIAIIRFGNLAETGLIGASRKPRA